MASTDTVILAEVRAALGSPSTTIISDATIRRQMNYSYYEIVTRYRHPEIEATATITTVDGTQTYATPTRYWYTQFMRDETNDRVLLYKPIQWILAQDTDTKGPPQYHTRQADTNLLYPTPDAVYSITHYHTARPAELAATPTSTVFNGLEWDEIVVWGAVWRCHQILGENDQMVHTRNIWRTLVGSMPESEVLMAEGSPQVIPMLSAGPIPGNLAGPTE
jgi:hypothetical protein